MRSDIVSARRGSIIVVEDEPVVSIYLRRRLEDLGWDVLDCVRTGEEAVRVGAQRRPDLMLMDVCLDGDVDGPQAALQLHDLFGIPSVFLTAYTDRETIERCKGALPLGYLTKPVDEQLLSLTLEMALSFDKTRQARAREEQGRRRVEARYADILKHAPDAIITVDDDLTIVVYSPSAERCFQYTAHEALGRPLHLLLPSSVQPVPGAGGSAVGGAAGAQHGSSAGSDPSSASIRIIDYKRKDGSVFPAEVAICRHEEGGRALHTAIIRDISQRRELERQRIGAQKMDAVGRLAASVANDFNNLLQAVGANHYLMALQARPELKPILQDCAELVARGSSLTRQLLSLSGTDDGEGTSAYPLRELLEQSVQLAARSLGAHVRIASNAATVEGSVRVARTQFEQVVSSLVANARDAMQSGGELRVEARPHPVLTGHALLEFKDTGLGISELDLPHIFEPFFTTKPPGVGTGLGLSVVKRIVERWDGRVSVESRHGNGSAFGITLPYADCGPPVLLASPAGRERVLLLEPSGHVRATFHWLLSARGYAVLSAGTLEQAERELSCCPGPDLIIVGSPRLYGAALPMLGRAPHSSRLLLITSGGELPLPVVRWPVLQRPFAPRLLLELVRHLLDQPSHELAAPPAAEGKQ